MRSKPLTEAARSGYSPENKIRKYLLKLVTQAMVSGRKIFLLFLKDFIKCPKGVSVSGFLLRRTFQRLTEEGLKLKACMEGGHHLPFSCLFENINNFLY